MINVARRASFVQGRAGHGEICGHQRPVSAEGAAFLLYGSISVSLGLCLIGDCRFAGGGVAVE
jgi:hypothetical protein